MNLKQLAQKRREHFMEHISPEIQARLEKPEQITSEEYGKTRANSYERKLMMPKLDNEAFIHLIEYCMGQAGFHEYGKHELSKCYNDAVTNELLPELIRRFKEQNEYIEELERTQLTAF